MQRIKVLSRHFATATTDPVCLVLGAGAGIGSHVASKFSEGGYHAVLCRRSNGQKLQDAVDEIKSNGGSATGYLLNAVKPDAIEDLVRTIEKDIGPIAVAVYNLGSQIGTVPLAKTTDKTFEMGWRLGTFGLFRLAKSVLPKMAERGHGTLLVTSATSAMRGNAGQHSHAASMGGRRLLCQTLNAEYAPKNIHVAHVVVDGAVDAPDTLGKMLGPELFQQMKDKHVDGFISPGQVADTYWHLHQQHRSARSFEIDIRSWSDNAWFNSPVNLNKKMPV